MKKTQLIGGFFSALLLVSPLVSADSDYPAYDFQPKIVYQDESVIAQSKVVKAEAPKASATADKSSGGDDSTLIIGILALAGIGFAAYKKSAGASKKPLAGGSTGVSRYLEKQEGGSTPAATSVSGVERYLQNRV